MSTIDAKALRQISADAASPTQSAGSDDEQKKTEKTEPVTTTTTTTPTDRKEFIKQRWLNAINAVRDQISQVSYRLATALNSNYNLFIVLSEKRHDVPSPSVNLTYH